MVRIDLKLINRLGLTLYTNKTYYITYDTHTYVYLYIGTSLYEAIEHSLDFTIEEYNNGDELPKGIVTELTVWDLLSIITNDIQICRFKTPDDLFAGCNCSNSHQYPSSESSMEESEWEIDWDNYIDVDEELFLHPERLDDIRFPNDDPQEPNHQNHPTPQITMNRYLQALMVFCVTLLVCIIIVCAL